MVFYFLSSSAKRSIRSQNHSAAIYLRFTRTITGFHWPHSSHKSGSLERMYFQGGSFVPMILFQQPRQNSAIIITPIYDSKCIAIAMYTFGVRRRKLYAIHMYCEVKRMGSFKIPSTPPTTNKTIRFPNDVVEAVEKEIQGKNCTFSAFVIAAVRAALEDIRRMDA